MKLLPLSIFVTLVTAAAIPAANPTVDANLPAIEHDTDRVNRTCTCPIDCGAGVCWGGHCYYSNLDECFPDDTCDVGTCYHGYCHSDDIPWANKATEKPDDNDNDNNGDLAKRGGRMWGGVGHADESFASAMRAIREKTGHPWMKKRDPEDSGYYESSIEDLKCHTENDCGEHEACMDGYCISYDPKAFMPGKRDTDNTNKDVTCHSDDQCSPGICQDGICLLY